MLRTTARSRGVWQRLELSLFTSFTTQRDCFRGQVTGRKQINFASFNVPFACPFTGVIGRNDILMGLAVLPKLFSFLGQWVG